MKSTVVRTLGILSLLSGAAALAQPARAQTAADSHLVQIDLTLLSGSISYAHRVSKRSFAGIGVGIGPVAQRIIYSSGPFWDPDDPNPADEFDQSLNAAEFADVHAFGMHATSDRFQIEAGVRIAPVIWSRGSGSGDASFAVTAGGYIAPRVGWRGIKFGPRLQFGLMRGEAQTTREGTTDASNFVVILTPLVASVQFWR